MYAAYYAPRGRQRLYRVAAQLSQRYLSPGDLLIGIIGAEGSGKSTLIRGLFPGLELTNDDDGVNVTPAPLHSFSPEDHFSGHTFHIDIRYELAFKQKHQLVSLIKQAVAHGRRVVVEHFDLIYDALGYNAQVIFGIGEEIIVVRPSVFGPFPANIKSVVDKTIKFRLMAHSGEDITSMILARDYGYRPSAAHSDVKHGFVIGFPETPDINLDELEAKIKAVIAQDVPICIAGEDRIRIGDQTIDCTGTRTHVKSSGQIENFRLLKDYRHNLITGEYMLVGIVGRKEIIGFESINEFKEFNQQE
ncbi:MAG: alanine-tRNA synthetase second additional domain-containing protein [Verrucomicrobia bacterium]|nr:alanine-tRNA synthetase second additional domain-containing protein [Verrucomicrobiota bacterium]